MMVVFEVFVARGADPETLISAEAKRETKAQVMSPDDAQKAGFGGLPNYADQVVRLIAVEKRDAPWIHRALETSEAVGSFRMFDVD